MKSELKVKFLQFLLNKKKDDSEGFTLIELLVVVIIIGVLAAVALPNLLGQVGKARETEAKSALGSINRAQQAFYLEQKKFYADSSPTVSAANAAAQTWRDALGVNPGNEFYTYVNTSTATDTVPSSSVTRPVALFVADAKDPNNNGTRDYAVGMTYDTRTGQPTSGTFTSAVCVATVKDSTEGTVTATAAPTAATDAAKCTGSSSLIK